MDDRTLKVTLVGLAAAAGIAAFCALSAFVMIMLLVNRLDGREVAAAQAQSSAGQPVQQPFSSESEPRSSLAMTATLAPPATSRPPTPSPQSPAIITHTVQSGENLFRISLAYGVTVADIMAENGLFDARFITAGQQLRIPIGQAVAAPDPANTLAEAVTTPAGPPVATATLNPPRPTATATQLPRIGVNGLALESIVVMPPNVLQNARQIYTRGQELGRNPAAYSRLGDSTIENPHFMARFDEGPYVLGDYAFLQEAIDYFAGSHGRQGVGVRRGFHSWTVTDPMWADKSVCLPNENSVACEIRLHNPSILLVRLGSNDSGVPAGFEQNMRRVLDIAIESGVLPVLGTKADRFEGSNINNEIIRRLAAEYQLPLWDFDLVASTIPGRGLDVDAVHLTTFYAHDYTSPTAFQRGHGMHNLTALMALDVILREVIWESE